jgi:hypothetical protein
MSSKAEEDDPGRVLADTAEALIAAVPPAVANWVTNSVEQILDAWSATDPAVLSPEARTAALTHAAEAAGRAQAQVSAELVELLRSDLDAQRSTPLQVVRGALRYPTSVLEAAGVPAVQRDRFAEERFPDDRYGLNPASLAALDPGLGEMALVWGAAKAATHRRRHRNSA